MKNSSRLNTFLCCLAVVSAIPALLHATPIHAWSERFGDASEAQVGIDVAVDNSDDVILAGYFEGSVDFGSGPMTSVGWDIFLAKFNPSGGLLWAKHMGGGGDELIERVAVDASGAIVITGTVYTALDLGGGSLVSAGNEDIFLAKFDSSGNHQWSKSFGATDIQRPLGLTLDSSGNVLVVGMFYNSVNFGGGNLVSAGGIDAFLAKFDAAGTYLWSKRFGSADQESANGIAADATGNIFFAGTMRGAADLGGGTLNPAGGNDVVLAKFGADGSHQWSDRFGDSAHQASSDLATDPSGNVVLTGSYDGSINFGGSTFTGLGNDDIFLAKFSSAGTHQWSHSYGDANGQAVSRVRTDASGQITICGSSSGTVDFGGGPLTSTGLFDIVLSRFNPSGIHQWSMRFGDAQPQQGLSVAVGNAGSTVLSADLRGTVNFGGGSMTGDASGDIALVKFVEAPLATKTRSLGGIKALYR